jgi:quinol monooxygenase YgiN
MAKVKLIVTYTGESVGDVERFFAQIFEKGYDKKGQSDKGNHRYEFFAPTQGGKSGILLEEWDSKEDIFAHNAQPHMADFVATKEANHVTTTVRTYVEGDL